MTRIKTADYRSFGGPLIHYDADAPCVSCELPVESPSMGGTALCPWCDMGQHRDGTRWTLQEEVAFGKKYRENFERLQMRPASDFPV